MRPEMWAPQRQSGKNPPSLAHVKDYLRNLCSSSRQIESKIGLDDIEFNAATLTSYIAINGGTFIKRIDFSINFRQRPPPGGHQSQ
jgi:hypothetical protein